MPEMIRYGRSELPSILLSLYRLAGGTEPLDERLARHIIEDAIEFYPVGKSGNAFFITDVLDRPMHLTVHQTSMTLEIGDDFFEEYKISAIEVILRNRLRSLVVRSNASIPSASENAFSGLLEILQRESSRMESSA